MHLFWLYSLEGLAKCEVAGRLQLMREWCSLVTCHYHAMPMQQGITLLFASRVPSWQPVSMVATLLRSFPSACKQWNLPPSRDPACKPGAWFPDVSTPYKPTLQLLILWKLFFCIVHTRPSHGHHAAALGIKIPPTPSGFSSNPLELFNSNLTRPIEWVVK